MGDAPPQEGDGVGQIRKTLHLMVLRGLFPSLLRCFLDGLDDASKGQYV